MSPNKFLLLFNALQEVWMKMGILYVNLFQAHFSLCKPDFPIMVLFAPNGFII